jgi:hypothetical protein
MPVDVISERPSSDKTIYEVRIETQRTRGVNPSWELFETATSQMCRMRLEPSDGSIVFETNDGDGGGWVDAGSLGSGGSGDVVGPGSSTDNALARFDSTTGKLLQNSNVSVDDDGMIHSNMSAFGDVDGIWLTGQHNNSATAMQLGFNFPTTNHYYCEQFYTGSTNTGTTFAQGRGRALLVHCNSLQDTSSNGNINAIHMINSQYNGGAVSSSILHGIYNDGSEAFAIYPDGGLRFAERSSEPSTPSAGTHVLWVSDGLANGENGDLMLKTDDGSVWNVLKHGTGTASFLGMDGGAYPNTSTALYSVVVGGASNSNAANYAFLGGGQNCSIASGAEHGVVAGGNNNDITSTGHDNTISGGINNSITGTAYGVTIGGGSTNTTSGTGVFIGGGFSNDVSGQYGVIVGGDNGTVSGIHGFIGNGHDLTIGTGTFNAILSGNTNTIPLGGSYNFIGSGYQNTISATAPQYNIIVGGQAQTISTTEDWNFIGGGQGNTLSGTVSRCSILGGQTNQISSSGGYKFIAGGFNNAISTTTSYSFIVGGESNAITSGENVILVGGERCQANGNRAILIGGFENLVNGPDSFLGGGNSNDVTDAFCFLGGGQTNLVSNDHASLCGGEANTASGDGSHVGGGHSNTASGTDSCVPGGEENTASGTDSCVPGGKENVASAAYSQAGGYGALSRGLQGAQALANGYASVAGDRQSRRVVLRRQSTTNTFVSLTADGGASSVTDVIVVAENSVLSVRYTVIGVLAGGSEIARYTVNALVKRFISTTTVVWSDIQVDHEDNAAWDVQVVAYNVGGIDIQGKGGSGQTVDWCAILESVEVVI